MRKRYRSAVAPAVLPMKMFLPAGGPRHRSGKRRLLVGAYCDRTLAEHFAVNKDAHELLAVRRAGNCSTVACHTCTGIGNQGEDEAPAATAPETKATNSFFMVSNPLRLSGLVPIRRRSSRQVCAHRTALPCPRPSSVYSENCGMAVWPQNTDDRDSDHQFDQENPP